MSFWMWLQGDNGTNTEFNWDDYWTDIRNGVSSKKVLKKLKAGAYMTKPIFHLDMDYLADIHRYRL